MTELTIRSARPEDRAAIHDLTLSAYQEYAGLMGPMWARYRQNIVATLADSDSGEQFVAERGGALAGAVLLVPAETGEGAGQPWPEIRLLAVPPAQRGGGVGAALVDACIRSARGSGANAIVLHTSDMMKSAMSLYERLGFQRSPDLDFHPAPGVTVKGFRYPLTPG